MSTPGIRRPTQPPSPRNPLRQRLGFPRLRLRAGAAELLDLPWERPLAEWRPDEHGTIAGWSSRAARRPVSPSRAVPTSGRRTYALKEEPLEVASTEFAVLRHLETKGLPAVAPVGLAAAPERETAILVTEYLEFSHPVPPPAHALPARPGAYRDRLLDAMAWLLVDLHRAGVFWGDCSLANTLFRRDGDRIQAFLVDAETSEIHPALSDGQRAYDLDILVENVAFGLADLGRDAGSRGRLRRRGRGRRDCARALPRRSGPSSTSSRLSRRRPARGPGPDPPAKRARLRRGRDRVEPTGRRRARSAPVAVANRRFHARELERLTGIVALEGQARLLLNDLREYGAGSSSRRARSISEKEAAERWLHRRPGAGLRRLDPAIGPGRDPLQAYCDVLEQKWILSELAGRDVGLWRRSMRTWASARRRRS